MSLEYRTQITVTKMAGNGDVYKKSFNGTCTVGVRRAKGAIARKAEAYLQAVEKSQGPPPKGKADIGKYQCLIISISIVIA